jgi:protein-disulfide isomerase
MDRKLLLTTLFLLLPHVSKAETKLQWNQLIGIQKSSLSNEERQRIQTICDTTQNPYGCKGSIAECVAKGDLTARRHAGFVARMVKKGKDEKAVREYIKKRHQSVHGQKSVKLDLVAHPRKGSPDAKVVLVEFACFQCPFCAHLAPKLDALGKKYGNKLVQYFKFFPVRSHPEGVPAALAALAAHKQGKFWPMYKLLFENRADLKPEDLARYARQVGLDIEKWKKDMSSPDVLKTIENDKLEGMRIGVDGTPTFFINGKRYEGVHNIAELDDRIAEELDILEGRIP